VLVKKDLAKHRARLEVKTNGSPWARVNPAQIQQVLLNLLINARQAMPKGGQVQLRLGLDAIGRLVELSLTDTGVGIAPADLGRIFEPFYSTKCAPDDSGQGGTGLGLAVCRDIIEAHHGRLRAESRLGQGSTFTIILPVCQPPAATANRQGGAYALTGIASVLTRQDATKGGRGKVFVPRSLQAPSSGPVPPGHEDVTFLDSSLGPERRLQIFLESVFLDLTPNVAGR